MWCSGDILQDFKNQFHHQNIKRFTVSQCSLYRCSGCKSICIFMSLHKFRSLAKQDINWWTVLSHNIFSMYTFRVSNIYIYLFSSTLTIKIFAVFISTPVTNNVFLLSMIKCCGLDTHVSIHTISGGDVKMQEIYL